MVIVKAIGNVGNFRLRRTRDFLYVMQSLAPVCVRHPSLFISIMENITQKSKGQLILINNICNVKSQICPNILKQVSPSFSLSLKTS